MCGIVGGFGLSHVEVNRMCTLLRRRGPDGSGVWSDCQDDIALGHVRLAIIDVTETGSQPMISHDGRVVMVFNGEIYNYRDLRTKLEQSGEVFLGTSDSEVLLAMFANEGEQCIEKLNGIFSVAFWERDKKKLTVARDHMGVKPLYYYNESGKFIFASEMKAILRSGLVDVRLNPDAVLAHLGYLWSPGEQTIAAGVKKVLPGHVVVVQENRIVSDREFFKLSYELSPLRRSVEDISIEAASVLESAVHRQLVSDVPLGSFLSGGLDSSAIAVFAQRYMNSPEHGNRTLQCFSIDISAKQDEGFVDDLPYARRVASHIGVDLHVINVDDGIMNRLSEMVYFLDEPTPDPAALNTLAISELAQSMGVKVLLSGTGGDDVFSGYRRHFAISQERWWKNLPVVVRNQFANVARLWPITSPFGRRLQKAFRYAGASADIRLISYFLWIDPDVAVNLLAPGFRSGLMADDIYIQMLSSLMCSAPNFQPLNRMLYLDCKHFLADHNLNYTDKMGMAAGVEIRVPFLDNDVVKFGNSLPVELKQRGSTGKWILKKAMEPYLPRDIIYRPKSGFGAPLRAWLHGVLKPLVDEVLSDYSINSRGVFDYAFVTDLLERDRAGEIDASYAIFSMICIELWCRQFIDGNYAVDPVG